MPVLGHRLLSRRRSSMLTLATACAIACCTSHLVFLSAVSTLSGHRMHRMRRCAAEDPKVVDAEIIRSPALARLEEDIETKMAVAREQSDSKRLTELARLLVLAKASEGAAAWQVTAELRETVADTIATALSEFVGKEDYDIQDVAAVVDKKVGAAVSKLDNVYLTKEAAASAPPGTNPVILSEVMAPVVDEMKESAKESVLAFTGKDDYEFGDISKEADRRAKAAIAKLLGKEEYKFGDISKAAAAKAMDAVTSFTGKKDYEFGDVTKTLLRGALNFLEGDDKKKQ
eukprot:TRINITY_DN102574_c0_g1_i1.p1 TRINITY_DN102574_c0_g1~~TRINITY_DN102574_c0_g1_i1.p1  ORF type:complete len:287 (-),score=77.59 TRINITY_DN102574_c0_g1_i1:115-975(-)